MSDANNNNSLHQRPNRWPLAVVTGAASGIGACFAEQLRQQGYRLLLVDICGSRLSSLRESLENAGDANTPPIECCTFDLTDRMSVEALSSRLEEEPHVDLLVNNAGFGSLEEFTAVDVDVHRRMIALHVETPMRLIHAVLPRMKRINRGSIINVASLGAFAPCAQAVQYASTKAYLVIFSEALQEELRETNIRIQALCPGFVQTAFHATDAMRRFHERKIPDSLWTTPGEVVACSLSSLSRGRVVVIPGWRSRMLGLFMRMVMLKPIIRIATRPKRLPDDSGSYERDQIVGRDEVIKRACHQAMPSNRR
jgi:short-subunit dehydrogenase